MNTSCSILFSFQDKTMHNVCRKDSASRLPVSFHVDFSIWVEGEFEDSAHDGSLDSHKDIRVLVFSGA